MKKNVYLTIVFAIFSLISVNANTEATLWSEDFEGDWTANWYADAGTWEVGAPTSGPNAAHSGDNCAATVLGGNYSEPCQYADLFDLLHLLFHQLHKIHVYDFGIGIVLVVMIMEMFK